MTKTTKTIRTKVYRFEALGKNAKQTAIEDFRNDNYEDTYLSDEAWESIKAFGKAFDINFRSIDYLETYRNKYSFEMEDNILELSGIRLRTYLLNNYSSILFERKHYGQYKKRENGKYRYDRYSKIQTIESCCPFTGVCWNEDLLQPIRNFIDKPNSNDFKDLLEDSIHEVCKSVEGEINARNEDEVIIETIEANDYWFTQDGKISRL